MSLSDAKNAIFFQTMKVFLECSCEFEGNH